MNINQPIPLSCSDVFPRTKELGSGVASLGMAFLGHYAVQSWPILPSGNYRPLGQGQVLVGHSIWKKAMDTYNSPGLLAPDPALPGRVALMGRLRGPQTGDHSTHPQKGDIC